MYRKIIILTLWLVLMTGCAGVRNRGAGYPEGEAINTARTIAQVESRNLTNSGFFIQKGRITTTGDAGRISLLFTMKYVKPGNYLISLRSITGIEALRVFISSDTVLINDRLNQEVLYGDPYDFERITGIHPNLLRISLGDIIAENIKLAQDDNCSGGGLNGTSTFMGLVIKSVIDCGLEKVKSVVLSAGIPGETITIDYKRHRYDYFRIPRKIEVNDSGRNVRISLKIEKYIAPWIGEIEFIPGSGYTRRSLI